MSSATLLLGSNLGNKAAYIASATAAIERDAGVITRRTSILQSEPWGYSSDNFYLNQILVVDTDLQPLELLSVLQNIENQLGRTRSSEARYTDRTIDIDILYYDKIVLNHPHLQIPHPRIAEREFVLTLLCELSESDK